VKLRTSSCHADGESWGVAVRRVMILLAPVAVSVVLLGVLVGPAVGHNLQPSYGTSLPNFLYQGANRCGQARPELIHSGTVIHYNGWSRAWNTTSCGSGSQITTQPGDRANFVRLWRTNINGSTLFGSAFLTNGIPATDWGIGSNTGSSNTCGAYSWYVNASLYHDQDNGGLLAGNFRTTTNHAPLC
jgi:hypothetical protein